MPCAYNRYFSGSVLVHHLRFAVDEKRQTLDRAAISMAEICLSPFGVVHIQLKT